MYISPLVKDHLLWETTKFSGRFIGVSWYYKVLYYYRRPEHSTALGLLQYKQYNDVMMSVMASQITGVSIVWSSVGSGADQKKHQSSASLAFVRGIHGWSVNCPHKRPITREMFPFDDAIMFTVVPDMEIATMTIRRPLDRLIFIMEIPLTVKTIFI